MTFDYPTGEDYEQWLRDIENQEKLEAFYMKNQRRPAIKSPYSIIKGDPMSRELASYDIWFNEEIGVEVKE